MTRVKDPIGTARTWEIRRSSWLLRKPTWKETSSGKHYPSAIDHIIEHTCLRLERILIPLEIRRNSERPPGCGMLSLSEDFAEEVTNTSRNMYPECEPQHCTTVITYRTGQTQWTLRCSHDGHQSRNKTNRNSTCTGQEGQFPALQVETLRHWSSHQPRLRSETERAKSRE